jgi:NDP-sugar pyrophosphorylase family protein
MQLVIPMSGQGTRYKAAGYNLPKPLIPINGIPMIERLLKKFPTHWPTTFVLAENHKDTGLVEFLKKIRPQCNIFYVPKNSEGPALALEEATRHLPASDPVLVSYCDYGIKWDPFDFEDFVKISQCDACLISYRGFHAHYLSDVKYAYSKIQHNRVIEVKEKGSFTEQRENEFASCGAYYFKSNSLLIDALKYQKNKNLKTNGEFYTSLTTQAIIEMNPQARIKIYEIPYFLQWGTPQDLKIYEYWEQTYLNYLKFSDSYFINSEYQCDQILMPMAGLGSRIYDTLKIPKPLLNINELPMYKQALYSFPKAKKSIFVTLKAIYTQMSIDENEEATALEKTPAGQALTTELGLSKCDPNQSLVVTSCDHSVVIDPKKWTKFKENPDCDCAIFTVKGFPGVLRSSLSFSYIKSEPSNVSDFFPKVSVVSVKKPLSNAPEDESLLIGSFWFKNPSIAQIGINLLKSANETTNGELYLDSIFKYLISSGMTVREFPIDGYINWGDTNSLKEALYYYEYFCGFSLQKRSPFPVDLKEL